MFNMEWSQEHWKLNTGHKFAQYKNYITVSYCKTINIGSEKIGNFKRHTYWRSLILAIFQFNALENYFLFS